MLWLTQSTPQTLDTAPSNCKYRLTPLSPLPAGCCPSNRFGVHSRELSLIAPDNIHSSTVQRESRDTHTTWLAYVKTPHTSTLFWRGGRKKLSHDWAYVYDAIGGPSKCCRRIHSQLHNKTNVIFDKEFGRLDPRPTTNIYIGDKLTTKGLPVRRISAPLKRLQPLLQIFRRVNFTIHLRIVACPHCYAQHRKYKLYWSWPLSSHSIFHFHFHLILNTHITRIQINTYETDKSKLAVEQHHVHPNQHIWNR